MATNIKRRKIDRVYEVFCSTRSSLSADNYVEKISDFIKMFNNFSGTSLEERMYSGWVAAICEESYYLAVHGKDKKTRRRFKKAIVQVFETKNIPKCLTKSNYVICGKKQPALIESINPTFERFELLEELPNIFAATTDAIILGGSMSYVPFFGIRNDYANNDFSDIDLIFIQSESFLDATAWNIFSKSKLFYSEDIKIFLKRVEEYRKLLSEGRADIISQRFRIKGKRYTISIHFFPKKFFKRFVNYELLKRLKSTRDCDFQVRNYRADSFYHPCQARLSFDGSRIESGIWPESNNIRYGHIVSTSGFTIKNKKLYPGPFLTVVLPALLVFYSRTNFAAKCLTEFEKIIQEQASTYSVKGSLASYARAHHRFYLFCPGRYYIGRDSFAAPDDAAKLYVDRQYFFQTLCSSARHAEAEHKVHEDTIDAKIVKKFKSWKKRELVAMNRSIDFFINKKLSHYSDISSFKQSHWITVTSIKAKYSIIIDKADGSKLIVTYILSPNDIMSSVSYSNLINKFGKIFISSHHDPIESESVHPARYTLIVRLC